MDKEKIGSYRVLQKIGAGGMAKVYLAVHQDVPNLKVILKILDDPELGERFKQEADKLALLDGHASICRIKHFFNYEDKTVIAMEYIDGESLEEQISRQGQMEPDLAAQIVCDILDTLEFAHQKGIFHRDIKPGNIMIDKSGQVKVIDFGIAKGQSDPNLTRAGTACGTPTYMAPEQFNPTDKTNYALADVYAVGTTLYRMLCGDLPFKADNEFALRDAKLFEDPPNPRDLRSEIPAGLEKVILKAIARAPEDRFQSAHEMKLALRASAGGRPRVEKTLDMRVEQRPAKKSQLKLWGAAALVVVLSAAAYFLWPSTGPPAAPELLAPPDETLIDQTNRPTFIWSRAGQPGELYMLEYASDSTFAETSSVANLVDTSHTPAAPLPNGDYVWRLRAISADGVAGPYSTYRHFSIDVTLPETLSGMLVVTSNRASSIFVNDSLRADNSRRWEATLETGSYVVRVENSQSNEKALNETVVVAVDDTATTEFAFTFPRKQARPPKPKAATTEAQLVVLSIPTGASIFVDGQPQKNQTPHTLALPAGKRLLRVTLTGDSKKTMESQVHLVPNSENTVMFNFDSDTVLLNF